LSDIFEGSAVPFAFVVGALPARLTKKQNGDEFIDYKALAIGSCGVLKIQDEFN
jgi:hypothetical protein